jgi:hypothetical protein
MNTLSGVVGAEALARILNINESTVKKLAREKQIPCRFSNKRYRFNLKEMIRFFKKLEGGAA